MTDTELKLKGLQALIESLGEVGAERFVALIQRETFNYIKWQRELWEDKSVDEIHDRAVEYRKNQNPK